jgi:4-amino-4-deoxy-L-arabinose transferase-like glycosyltransferase
MLALFAAVNLLFVAILTYFTSRNIFKNEIDRFILSGLLFWVVFIATGQILSVCNLLNNVTAYIICSSVLCVTCYLIVKSTRITSISFDHDKRKNKFTLFEKLLISALAFLFLLNLVVVFFFPPNNWDSLTYHLPRLYFYFAQGNLSHFTTPNERQVYFPYNVSLLQFPVVVYGIDHHFFNLLNLITWVLCGALIYRLAYLISGNKKAALLSTFLGLTGTAVLAQATTTNNDLYLGFTVLAFLYFFFLFTIYKQKTLLLQAAIAFGIALGTKVTMLFFVPGILLIFYRYRTLLNANFKYSLFSIFIALLLSMPGYIENYRDSGFISAPGQNMYRNKPWKPQIAMLNGVAITSQATLNPANIIYYNYAGVYDDFFHKTYKFALSSILNNNILPSLIGKWENNDQFYKGSKDQFHNLISNNIVEDEIWFGAGSYVFLLALIIYFRKPMKLVPNNTYLHMMLLLIFLFPACYCLLMKWQPWSGRFFVPVFLLASSFSGIVLLQQKYSQFWRLLGLMALFVILIDALFYLTTNDRRGLNKTDIDSYAGILPSLKNLSVHGDSVYIVRLESHGNDQRIYPLLHAIGSKYYFQRTQIQPHATNLISVLDTGYFNSHYKNSKMKYMGKGENFWFLLKEK